MRRIWTGIIVATVSSISWGAWAAPNYGAEKVTVFGAVTYGNWRVSCAGGLCTSQDTKTLAHGFFDGDVALTGFRVQLDDRNPRTIQSQTITVARDSYASASGDFTWHVVTELTTGDGHVPYTVDIYFVILLRDDYEVVTKPLSAWCIGSDGSCEDHPVGVDFATEGRTFLGFAIRSITMGYMSTTGAKEVNIMRADASTWAAAGPDRSPNFYCALDDDHPTADTPMYCSAELLGVSGFVPGPTVGGTVRGALKNNWGVALNTLQVNADSQTLPPPLAGHTVGFFALAAFTLRFDAGVSHPIWRWDLGSIEPPFGPAFIQHDTLTDTIDYSWTALISDVANQVANVDTFYYDHWMLAVHIE